MGVYHSVLVIHPLSHLEVGTLHIWLNWFVFLLLVVLSEVSAVDRVVLALLDVIAGNQRSHFEIIFFQCIIS